jgi:hypothetical protein
MSNIGNKQLGEALRVERDRDVQATVTHITNWSTTGELKCTLLNGDVIWVNASGNLQEIAVSDVIWVRKFGVGVRSQYRMTGYFKQSGGTYAPSAIRQDVQAASKPSELWASDGAPQAVDVDASGNITLNSPGGDQDTIISGNTEPNLLRVDAGTDAVHIGDWDTNYAAFAIDGELTLVGTAKATTVVDLPLSIGGGTADIEAFLGAPSINLDADGETFITSFRAPSIWDAASDLTLVLMVANEIAETDGDDVSITCQIRGYADGETMSDAGQAVTCVQDLTGGDEAINVVNRVTGVLDYDHGTYPIAAGDVVIVEATVNLGGAGECTGPLHVVGWWIEFTRDRLGA